MGKNVRTTKESEEDAMLVRTNPGKEWVKARVGYREASSCNGRIMSDTKGVR